MLLDIGAGILASIFVSRFFGFNLAAPFVIGGVVFSLLMDADYVFHLARGGNSKDAHKHRDLLHLPFLYIPIGVLLISPYSRAWAVLFGICSFIHFLHDSVGLGWGIQWLYPLRKDHYTFFYRYQPPGKEKLPRRKFYIWRHEDIDVLAKKYGDEDWVKNIYLRWHPYAVIEFLVFLFSLLVLFLNFR